ncbi:protein SCO1/2 [Reinekea marinisedimentorum]|uniref:Protein SCO1/2 n=1 Tax=Reinekea marinisedimentorum TaxID=230495 RepID=A0A4R3IB59_9GAMM|nr:protein SCO1/2 [Reinekea marinisedimentorum]
MQGSVENQSKTLKPVLITVIVVTLLLVPFLVYRLVATGDNLKTVLEENNVLLFTEPRSVPFVELNRHDGSPFTSAQFSGQWDLVNFGYTYCPDICPTNMADMKIAYNQLAEAGLADQVNFWMVTVDPERDSTQQLSLYVPFFHPDFVGLTGKPESIATLATQLSAVYYREGDGEGYTVAHSDNYAIIDPNGKFVALMRPPHRPAHIVTALTRLIGQ